MENKKSIFKATAVIFIFSLVAKVIGFIKSIIQASYFGATIYTDAFNVSNGFSSNILYMLSTAIAVAFVPIYIQRKNKDNSEKKFASVIITVLSLISIAISAILVTFAPLIVKVIAPSYTGEVLTVTVQFFRVLSLGFMFSLAVSLFSNLLNAEKIYGFSAICSVINSVVLIGLILCLAKKIGVWALVIAVPISYFIQWCVLYIKGKKYASITFRYGLKDEGIKILLVQALPVFFSQATVEINQVVDRALLTAVSAGALTAVTYASVLSEFVTSLVSTPVSTVMFTELSEAGVQNNNTRIITILKSCYKIFVLVCLPIISIIFLCATDIVSIVYNHGSFSGQAILDCAEGLKYYGICLLPVCIKSVLSKAYYAVNDTRRPMIIGVLEVITNITLSVVLVKYFGIAGVVGATAIASIIFIIVMLIDYNRKYLKVINIRFVIEQWKILVAIIISILIIYPLKSVVVGNYFFDLIIKTILCFSIYFGILFILKEDSILKIIESGIGIIKKRR